MRRKVSTLQRNVGKAAKRRAIAKGEVFGGPAWKAQGQRLIKGDPRWALGTEQRQDIDWKGDELRKLPTELGHFRRGA